MSTPIPSHLSVHEINQHKLDVEYKHWISRLEFIETELDFYSKLLGSSTFSDQEESTEIIDLIPTIKKENKEVVADVHRYRNNLEGYRECEDLECDNFYLNDHEKFRVVLEQHSARMRDFKTRVFNCISSQLA